MLNLDALNFTIDMRKYIPFDTWFEFAISFEVKVNRYNEHQGKCGRDQTQDG